MKNNIEFQEEIQREISKIEKQNQLINQIINENTKIDILQNDQNQQIDDILDKNNKYLYKLKSNEFEIAIVGLEKAGKSTFANALIGNDVLPSAPERCTFTSTRLTNGADKAIVEFYNEDEFNKIFIELLKDIEYPNYETESYKTISLEKFHSFFNALETKNPNLFKNHVGKTDEEIKDIINCRDKLILTGKVKEFTGDELLTDTFQMYIKGENKGKDTSKPRSVKKVEINSSKLQKLETAIIYDVPGFDSPTKIHERQTIERLKSADAIILVTNVGRNPSLVGTQLNIITNNSDSDGIPLRDKLFVFGNQLDTANSEAESKGNIKTLQENVEKYKIGEQKRVFTGAALKYLVIDHKIIKKDDYKISYEFDSGIEKIYNELIYYYEHERFEILKRKIDTNRRELKSIFKEILEQSEMDFDPNFAENEKNRITREAYKNIENALENNLKILKNKLKKEIWDEKYFSQKFKEDVQNLDYFKLIDEDDINNIKIYKDDSLTLDTPIEKMNQAIREILHSKFLQEFSNLIKYMTDEKSKDIELRILRTFVSSIVDDNSSIVFDEIEQDSEKLIQQLTSDISHNEGRFTYLIERFSRDIFDILISSPLYTHDRKDKYQKASVEFEYLDKYYNAGNGILVKMILTGKKEGKIENILSLANTLVSWASNALTWSNNATKVLEISTKIIYLSKNNINFNIDEILNNKQKSQNEEEVLNEINQDINNLRDILENAVTPAINLESAFLNSIDKQIKILINSFKESNTKNSNVFNNFIAKVVPKIKSDEIGSINKKLENYKLQQEVLKQIKKFDF